MFVNRDNDYRIIFTNLLERLDLKEVPKPEPINLISGSNVTFNSQAIGVCAPSLYVDSSQESCNIDEDNNVRISKRDIDLIAQRVVELLKKEGSH